MKRFVPLILLCPLGAALPTGCTSVPVQTLVEHVTMTGGEYVPKPDAITGVIREGFDVTHSERTNRVPLILGDGLSVTFVFPDPARAPREVRLKVNYPPMHSPLLGPLTDAVDRIEPTYWDESRRIVDFNYRFDAEWELVPGHWHVEIWDGRRKLAEADLDTYLPKPGGGVAAAATATGTTAQPERP